MLHKPGISSPWTPPGGEKYLSFLQKEDLCSNFQMGPANRDEPKFRLDNQYLLPSYPTRWPLSPSFLFFELSACEVRAAWKEKPHHIIRNAVRIKNTGCCHTHPITAGGHVGWVRQQEKYSITYHGLQICLESKGIFPLLSSCPSWPLSVFL